jgi:hypothetical protein
MQRSAALSLILAGGLIFGACGIGDEAGPFLPGVTLGSGAENGDQRMMPVGSTLPDKIRVVALKGGHPVPNLPITWTTDGGSVSPATARTNQDGVAEASWTLGPKPGQQFLTATSPEVNGAELVFYALATKDGRADW